MASRFVLALPALLWRFLCIAFFVAAFLGSLVAIWVYIQADNTYFVFVLYLPPYMLKEVSNQLEAFSATLDSLMHVIVLMDTGPTSFMFNQCGELFEALQLGKSLLLYAPGDLWGVSWMASIRKKRSMEEIQAFGSGGQTC